MSHRQDCPAVERGWPEMGALTEEEREVVLACPDPSHNSVRQLWKVRRR